MTGMKIFIEEIILLKLNFLYLRVIDGQDLSEAYKGARDAREILVDSQNMLLSIRDSMERLRNIQKHLSEMHASNSTDPEVIIP